MGFLRDEIRQRLDKGLAELRCPEHIRERVTDIPEGAHDQYMWAHLKVCENGLNNAYDNDHESELFWRLSALSVCAIRDEALARNMGDDDFPSSRQLMHVVEAIAVRQAGYSNETKH